MNYEKEWKEIEKEFENHFVPNVKWNYMQFIEYHSICRDENILSFFKKKFDKQRRDLKESVESAWKYGDLREGNFKNCMNNIFEK